VEGNVGERRGSAGRWWEVEGKQVLEGTVKPKGKRGKEGKG
jgi:hypothetical protein